MRDAVERDHDRDHDRERYEDKVHARPAALADRERPHKAHPRDHRDRGKELHEDRRGVPPQHPAHRLDCLNDPDEHEDRREHRLGEGREDPEDGGVPYLAAKEGFTEEDRGEDELRLGDRGAVVEDHDVILGALPVDHKKVEGRDRQAENFEVKVVERAGAEDVGDDDHNAERVDDVVEEVAERRGRPETPRVLAVDGIHGLEEEYGKPGENLDEIGNGPRREE